MNPYSFRSCDVYNPLVVAQSNDSFQTLQVFRDFDLPNDESDQLCRFDWPSGNVEILKRYSRVRIWPVIDADLP